jgi:hypothetical protein
MGGLYIRQSLDVLLCILEAMHKLYFFLTGTCGLGHGMCHDLDMSHTVLDLLPRTQVHDRMC